MQNPIVSTNSAGEAKVMLLKPAGPTKFLAAAVFLIILGDSAVRYLPYFMHDLARPPGPLGPNLLTSLLAIACLYLVAALGFDSKKLIVTAKKLKLHIDPIPFPGEKDVNREEIRGFRLLKKRKGTATDLMMILKNGQGAPLLQSLRPHATAVEIKQWLEASLGLPPTKDEA